MKINNSKIRAFCTAALMTVGIVSVSAGDNILKNPEFADQGKFWNLRYNNLQNSIREENGKKFIRLEMAAANGKGINVFSQSVQRPKGGNYVYSVELSPSRKFEVIQVVIWYPGDDGKTIYRGHRMKAAEFLDPGKWVKINREFKIPEGKKSVGIAVEIRDAEPEGFLLIRNPELRLRDE